MKNIIIRLFGLNALSFFGDPPGFDRFQWFKHHVKHGSLRTLDAGCGSGTFTLYASSVGNDAVGISFEKQNIEVAKERAKILNIENVKFLHNDLKDLAKISNEIGLFDQIICFETIEHIKDDEKTILNLSNLLKSQGRLLLTVPYKYYHHLLGDKLSEEEDGGHVRWGYTHKEIRDIFTKCNLDVEIEDYVSGFISQQICNVQRFLSIFLGKLSWFVVFPLRIFLCLDGLVTRVLNYPYLSIGVIGVKRN